MRSSKQLATEIIEMISNGEVIGDSVTELIQHHEKDLLMDFKTEIDSYMASNTVVNLEHSAHGQLCSALADVRNNFMINHFNRSK